MCTIFPCNDKVVGLHLAAPANVSGPVHPTHHRGGGQILQRPPFNLASRATLSTALRGAPSAAKLRCRTHRTAKRLSSPRICTRGGPGRRNEAMILPSFPDAVAKVTGQKRHRKVPFPAPLSDPDRAQVRKTGRSRVQTNRSGQGSASGSIVTQSTGCMARSPSSGLCSWPTPHQAHEHRSAAGNVRPTRAFGGAGATSEDYVSGLHRRQTDASLPPLPQIAQAGRPCRHGWGAFVQRRPITPHIRTLRGEAPPSAALRLTRNVACATTCTLSHISTPGLALHYPTSCIRVPEQPPSLPARAATFFAPYNPCGQPSRRCLSDSGPPSKTLAQSSN